MADVFLFAGFPGNGVVIDQLSRCSEVTGFLYREGDWKNERIAVDQLIEPVVLDGDGIHQALEGLHRLSGEDGLLTLIWLYDCSQDEDNNIQAAILRCYLCHSARVLVVNVADNATSDAPVSGCWISDLVPVINIRSFDDICSRPTWSGPCWCDDKSLLMEVYEVGSQSVKLAMKAAYMDICEKVRLSSIHACLLDETFTAQLTPLSESRAFLSSLFQEADCGYIVRALIPVFEEPKSKYELSLTAIRSTSAWKEFVLETKNITVPDCRPKGPVHSVFYLLYPFQSESRTSCQLLRFNPHPLADTLTLITKDCVNINKSMIEKLLNDVESIYDKVSGASIPINENIYTDYLKLSQEEFNEPVTRWLENSNAWEEKQALSEHTQRRQKIEEMNKESKLPDAPVNAEVQLTLDDIVKKFSSDGLPREPKYQLPSGNHELPELRLVKWPECQLYYGPGISYHKDDSDKSNRSTDPRLLIYRDTRSFSETASIFSSERASVTITTSSKKSEKDSNSVKQPTKKRTPSKAKSVRPIIGKRGVVSGARAQSSRSSQSHNKNDPTCSSNSSVQQKSVDMPDTCTKLAENTASAPASSSAEPQPEGKMERNKRNEARLRDAVEKALHKRKLSKSHKSYEEIYKLLFQVTYAAVKKLENSLHLERRIQSIANKLAGPLVATMTD